MKLVRAASLAMSVVALGSVPSVGYGQTEPRSEPGNRTSDQGLVQAALPSEAESDQAAIREEFPDFRMRVRHVEVRGDGPIPMIMIPDIGFDWTVFETFMDRNAEQYTMYAVTLPGMAGTEVPDPEPNRHWDDLPLMRNSVAALRLLIRERDLEQPVLMGHGMGGHLAVWIATRHPEESRAAISIDGMPVIQIGSGFENDAAKLFHVEGKVVPPFRAMNQQQWNNHFRQQILAWVSDDIRGLELAEIHLRTMRGVVLQYSIESLFSDLTADLKSNQRPVLFIGAQDPNMPAQIVGMRWRALLSNDPTNTVGVIFENCRHFVMDDDPWRLDDTVRDFLMGRHIENSLATPDLVKPVHPELSE